MGSCRAFAVSLLLLLLLAGCAGNQHYENRLKGFSAEIPAGWTAYEDEMRVIFIAPDPSAQIAVLAAYSQENSSLENLSLSMRSRFSEQGSAFSILSESLGQLAVSGEPALRQSFLMAYKDAPGRTARSDFVYLKSGQRYYILSMVFSPDFNGENGTAQYDAAFSSFLASFKLI